MESQFESQPIQGHCPQQPEPRDQIQHSEYNVGNTCNYAGSYPHYYSPANTPYMIPEYSPYQYVPVQRHDWHHASSHHHHRHHHHPHYFSPYPPFYPSFYQPLYSPFTYSNVDGPVYGEEGFGYESV
ncbi:hypothetical protein GOP56_13160 [Brevibacillus sp. 7WMA2]|uniref:hypothetical protein n=1 Tax=Brevibacillus TaxID=55080 RepID=UPI0013A79121|nr:MULTISPECIES: hypothetical protein [Brevibacillus]MCR8996548.1 hypothetical protein [Brevibacillus laterosporus]QIC06468.1 hypothetical protein GOP56_13160 [Brevibacillus sp. 7WMA2]WPS87350.1 hypothetical protein SMD22_23190 [Brevibacillus halotolerans]